MTKYCSKKVLIIGLCFTTILASLLIGKNIYQGTPTFQNIIGTKVSEYDDAVEHNGGGRRGIKEHQNQLPVDIVRQGGFANDGINIVQGGTGESVELNKHVTDQLDQSSEGSVGHEKAKKVDDFDLPLVPRIVDRKFQKINPNYKWTLESDPKVPRILSKIVMTMPQEIKNDLPDAYKKIGPGRKKDVAKQFQVVSDVYKQHGYTQRLPELLNIGVKKSGTNAVGFFVTLHPQIIHSMGNEVHFFDRNYDKGLEYYRIRMGFAKEDQFLFEKTPKYFVTPDAPQQISTDLPKNIKFILSVRDPVRRALSDFRHERELQVRRQAGRNGIRNIKSTPEKEGLYFEHQVLDKLGNVNASNMIVDTSYYAKHFKNWLKYFPRERFMIIDLDTLEKGAFYKLKELEQFLGLKPYFEEKMFYYDKARHGTCVYGGRRPCPPKSTPGVLPKAEPSDATLEKLYEFYRPSNKEFMQLTGMDFPWAHL